MPLKFILVLLLCFARISTAQQTDSEQHPGPLTVERITELNKTLNRSLEESTELIQRNPNSTKRKVRPTGGGELHCSMRGAMKTRPLNSKVTIRTTRSTARMESGVISHSVERSVRKRLAKGC